ncbi:MAG: hypothetical protein LUH07_02185, partial [Lachnospiraceae bacterium]|nr:hypothetical protein [Lachnospiraceae bacterium]
MRDFLKRYWRCLKQNVVLKVITAFELLLLMVLLANCFHGRCDYTFSVGELNISSEHVWESVDENGIPVYAASSEG